MRTIAPRLEPDPADEIIAGFRGAIAELRCIGSERLHRAGISMAHFHLLSMLDRHGEMPMGRIADLLDVSMSNATGLIDRIEERGLVERIRVKDDRRVVHVRLTPDGVRLLEDVELGRNDLIERILAKLDDAALRRVAGAIQDLRGALADLAGEDPHLLHDHDHRHAPPAPRA